ncbi:hypothetical protein WA026_021650 [Henosepilachna vigintioctopunctata]|uniref:Uncharacterized protein n=1 Tax=Henosepilachna vigintioctopunctata TaxID=420089 RepID=A0AAW1U6Z9_9CUCU
MCGSSGPLFRMCSALKPVCRSNIWPSSSRCWENWEKPVDRWLRNLVCSRIRMPKLRKVRPMYSAEHVAQLS